MVQLSGGNDGLNTLIPYTDARYHQLRPNLGFRAEELKDEAGASTVLNGEFGLHPSLKELKQLYDEGKLAVIQGVGYPNPDLSHEISTTIWQTARPENGRFRDTGWLGRYADLVFAPDVNFSAVALGSFQPPVITAAAKTTIPTISGLGETAIQDANGVYRDLLINSFRQSNRRSFPAGSFAQRLAETGASADRNTELLETLFDQYQSSVVYPEENPAARALQSVVLLTAIFPQANIIHLSYPTFFDTHARQIGVRGDELNKHIGFHATQLRNFSQAVKPFFEDMAEHGLGNNFLLMVYSEFGRRPNENASRGTDHGTAAPALLLGNRIKGGDLYGQHPSLRSLDLDDAGNQRFTTDFRSIYATILDRWLAEVDSAEVLGQRFPHVEFL
jgi:uncharacterized protein (DUF1501 family)